MGNGDKMRGRTRILIFLLTRKVEGNKARNGHLRSDDHIFCSVNILLCLIADCDQAGHTAQVKTVLRPVPVLNDHLELLGIHDFLRDRAF